MQMLIVRIHLFKEASADAASAQRLAPAAKTAATVEGTTV
jgi:hypothetical protein